MKRAVIIVLVLLAAAAGWYFWDGRNGDGRELALGGNVDIREVNLAFRVDGRVADVKVEEGDLVSSGDIIAVIDPEPFQTRLAQAEGALGAAQAAEALLQAGTRNEEVARLKAQMEALRAAAVNAQVTFRRQRDLLSSNSISRQEFDNAKASWDQTSSEFQAAQQAYFEARNGARSEDLARAEAERKMAEAQRDTAALQLRDTTLVSPEGGTVLTRVVEPGSMVAAGSPVVTLSLDRPVRVRAYVDEPNLGRVAPGTEVLVFTDSRPDHPYRGTVGFVSPRAEFTPKQVETQDLRTALVYRIRVTIADPDNGLRQGMPVTVRLAAKGR
ncbi:MAG: secretion protein HlyD [Desulfovibrionaceae bacterium]|nr:secretion protein HlyD [Desulfovibrionaceae bacterium]